MAEKGQNAGSRKRSAILTLGHARRYSGFAMGRMQNGGDPIPESWEMPGQAADSVYYELRRAAQAEEQYSTIPAPSNAADLESRLWPNGPVCPRCGGTTLTTRPNGFHRCNPCGKFTFNVREGTIFGRSKIALNKWVYAMYLVVTSRKGISSLQLAKEIGVTQKTAWFMLQRLREACGGIDMDKLRCMSDTPKCLDAIVDAVLRYKPAPKTKSQKRRAQKAKKAKAKS